MVRSNQGRNTATRIESGAPQGRCRANSAHARQTGPDSGLDFQAKSLKPVKVFSLRSAAATGSFVSWSDGGALSDGERRAQEWDLTAKSLFGPEFWMILQQWTIGGTHVLKDVSMIYPSNTSSHLS